MADDQSWQNTGFSQQQWTALQGLLRGIPSQPGPPGPPGEAGPPGTVVTENALNPTRWNPGDLGFFDPNYDNKSVSTGSPIEHTGKETYFRDVHLFVERARDLVVIKGNMVRENLWMSLRGTALEWWTAELSPAEKRITRFGEGVEEWSTLLTGRFKEPATVAIDAVLRERYTIRDASSRRESREYAQKILRSVKDAGMTLVKNQLDIVYNGIDLELRRDIKKSEDAITINSFLMTLDDCKHEWWAYVSRHGRNAGIGSTASGSSFQGNRQLRSHESRPSGQYAVSLFKLLKQASTVRSALKRKSRKATDYRTPKQVRFSNTRATAASFVPVSFQ